MDSSPANPTHPSPGPFGLGGFGITPRHIGLVVLAAVATPMAALAAHLWMPAPYVSESKVLVKLGREFMGPAVSSGRSSAMYRLNEAINSEIEILSSRELAQEVVQAIGLELLYPKIAKDPDASAQVRKQMGAAALSEHLSSSGVAESSVIRVTFAHEDPVLAQRTLEAVMEAFQTRHLEVFSGPRLGAADDSVEAAQEALREAEDRRTRYREEQQVFDTQEERAILLRQRADLRTALEQVRAERSQLQEHPEHEAFLTELDKQEAAEIASLRAEERRLLENYLPKSKAVRLVRAQIASRESMALERRYARAETLRAEESRLEGVLTSVQSDLTRVEAKERTLRELDRAVSLEEARLVEAQTKRQEAILESQLDAEKVTSIVVIDQPSLPLVASGVGLKTKLAAGTLAGGFLGVGIVLLLQLLERARREATSRSGGGRPPFGHSSERSHWESYKAP